MTSTGRTSKLEQARDAAEDAGDSEWARRLVLAGWAAKGVVYLALAWVVLQMALGSAPEEASATGALEYIASTGPGTIALFVVGVGLVAYAVGRVLEVTVMAEPSVEALDKAAGFGLAVVYAGLAVSAFGIATAAEGSGSRSSGGSGGSSSQQQGTAFLFDLPAGRWIVGAIGVAIAGIGLYNLYAALETRFLATLRQGEMSSSVRRWTRRIGQAAYAAKGVVFLLFAWFLIQAAVDYDADEAATGLDGTLRRVAQESWGTTLLTAIAVGLLAYALFSFLEARYRRVGVGATGTG